MEPITFPGLGLSFSMDRVAFQIFGKNIYWYGIIIAVGFLLAVLFCCRQGKKFGITNDNIVDMLLFAVPISLICARLYYVIFYLDLYRRADGSIDWGETIAIWDGGIAIYGGIIGAVVTLAVFCRVKKIKFGAFADLGALGLLIGQAVGRWGNFVNQEAFGGPTDLPWRMGLWVNGTYTEVHPTFLYESLWNIVGLLLIYFLVVRARKFDGEVFLCYIAWYGLGRFFIEGLRTDSLYFFGLTLFGQPVRTSQLLAAVSCLTAVALLAWNLLARHHTPEELYVNRRPEAEQAEEKKGA